MGPSLHAFTDELVKIAGLQALPGVAPGGTEAQEALEQLQNQVTSHGLQGRLQRPAVVGNRPKDMQGPRAYGPRLSKP